jgi:hypothetical protein
MVGQTPMVNYKTDLPHIQQRADILAATLCPKCHLKIITGQHRENRHFCSFTLNHSFSSINEPEMNYDDC